MYSIYDLWVGFGLIGYVQNTLYMVQLYPANCKMRSEATRLRRSREKVAIFVRIVFSIPSGAYSSSH
jgi:hypothetical protein